MIVGQPASFDELRTYTPVNTSILRVLLKDYHDRKYITEGFTYGFSLGVSDEPRLRSCTKMPLQSDDLVKKLMTR